MAGKKGASGRPRKPKTIHIAQGTFRKDRHGAKDKADVATGSPVKPDGLPPEAGQLWDLLVSELGSIPKRLDTPALEALCRHFALYRKALRRFEKKGDKESRIAWSACWKEFDRQCAKFGMTPADRQRIDLGPIGPVPANSDKSRFFAS